MFFWKRDLYAVMASSRSTCSYEALSGGGALIFRDVLFSRSSAVFFVYCSIMLSMMSSQYPRNKKTETSFTLHLKIWISCTFHCSIMLSMSSQYPRNKKQKLHLNFISKFEYIAPSIWIIFFNNSRKVSHFFMKVSDLQTKHRNF